MAHAATQPIRPDLAISLRRLGGERQVAVGLLALLALFLLVIIALPLWALLSKSFQSADGSFVGLANYRTYFTTPTLVMSVFNSVWVAALTTAIVIPLAFVYAYALTRSRMPFKGIFYALALLPLFAPSLLSAISFLYIFGNQGLLR